MGEFWVGLAAGTVFGHVLASIVLRSALGGMLKMYGWWRDDTDSGDVRRELNADLEAFDRASARSTVSARELAVRVKQLTTALNRGSRRYMTVNRDRLEAYEPSDSEPGRFMLVSGPGLCLFVSGLWSFEIRLTDVRIFETRAAAAQVADAAPYERVTVVELDPDPPPHEK